MTLTPTRGATTLRAMSAPAPANTASATARWPGLTLDVALCLALAALAVWLRWPALSTEGFHNEDTAGITYQADLLRRGLLPYVHAYEIKEPGSFFATWLSWSLFGRSLVAVQRVACFWSVVGLWGVYVGARVLYPEGPGRGRVSALLAAIIYAVVSPTSDSIDINYNTWMATPAIWTAVCFVWAVRHDRLGGLVGAGALLALTALMKRQGGTTFPLYVGILALPWVLPLARRVWRRIPAEPAGFWLSDGHRATGKVPRVWPRLFALGGGLVLGFVPISAFYAAKGHLNDFLLHYFLSPGGWRYVKGELGWDDRMVRLYDGLLGFWEFMAVPTWLLVVALVAAQIARPGFTGRGLFLAGHFALSFLGAALGFRFFKGYYLQILPAAVWIAAHPSSPLVALWQRGRWPGLSRRARGLLVGGVVLALAGAVPAARQDLKELGRIRRMRQHSLDHEAQRVARVVVANTGPTDKVWVWGRWAWPVYYHSDRLAPTRFHKVLGVITTNLTNTWRRPTLKTTFVERGPEADQLMAELKADEPAFIVVSRNEDYQDFTDFRELLRTRYRVVPHLKMRQFVTYVRKDHPLKVPPRPNPGRRPTVIKAPTKSAPLRLKPGAMMPGSAARASAPETAPDGTPASAAGPASAASVPASAAP